MYRAFITLTGAVSPKMLSAKTLHTLANPLQNIFLVLNVAAKTKFSKDLFTPTLLH